jgi:hypothetical protein
MRTLAVDGPAAAHWDQIAATVSAELTACGFAERIQLVDMREAGLPWAEIEARTRSAALGDDPDFEKLAVGSLADLIDSERIPTDPVPDDGTVRLAFGPGAALVAPDVLWWADLPKRHAERAVGAGGRNLLAPAGVPATTKRLFYVDWPLLDRHRDLHGPDIELWLDTQNLTDPTWMTGRTLRDTCAQLAALPHRTLPVFNSTPWGGQWARRALGHNQGGPNTALGYELIAPESGVLVGPGPDDSVEVPFQLIVSMQAEAMLGPGVHERFGTSFPIRFDYLDTVDGGNLSVHCHPRDDYMRTVFGWPYTQHETYYVMVGSPENSVFLGLRDGADVKASTRRHIAPTPTASRSRSPSSSRPSPPHRTSCSSSRRAPRTAAARATSYSRSARRRTFTRCAATTGYVATAPTGSGPSTSSTRSATSTPTARGPQSNGNSSNPRERTSRARAGTRRSSGSCPRCSSKSGAWHWPRTPWRSRTPTAASTSSTWSRATGRFCAPRQGTSIRSTTLRPSSSRPPSGRTTSTIWAPRNYGWSRRT